MDVEINIGINIGVNIGINIGIHICDLRWGLPEIVAGKQATWTLNLSKLVIWCAEYPNSWREKGHGNDNCPNKLSFCIKWLKIIKNLSVWESTHTSRRAVGSCTLRSRSGATAESTQEEDLKGRRTASPHRRRDMQKKTLRECPHKGINRQPLRDQ